MSYYQRPMGDYATGGYAVGDPGLFSGLLALGTKVIGGSIAHYKRKAARKVAGYVAPDVVAPSMSVGLQQPPGFFPGMDTVGKRAGLGGRRAPGYTMGLPAGAVDGIPRGFHLAKDGSGRYVRNRRMNIANPRALRRAMRRVSGFEKLAKRTISFTKRTRIKKRTPAA